MAEPEFQPIEDRSSPRYSWCSPHGEDSPGEDLYQYRAKVQRYSAMPAEVTIQRVGFDQTLSAYKRAWENGLSSVPVGGRRVEPEQRDSESLQRAMFRAKTKVRKLVTELAPSALVTFTTREVLTLEQLLWVWRCFARSLRQAGLEFEYVAVPERHPSNPEHLHLHVAYRGKTPFNTLRRLWHMALEARHGRRVVAVLRGAESPGNIDVQRVKSRDALGRVRKVARYVSKYITKDMIAEFNRKRYWPSKGISLEGAHVFWLDSTTMSGAILEALAMFGQVEDGVCCQRLFRPSDRVAWVAIDPRSTPPPPF